MPVSSKNCSPFTAHCSLLFIHGWATDSRIWQHQVKEFSKDYEVIAVDLPGHSEKDVWSESTLRPAVEKVLLSTVHCPLSTGFIGIGWSLGGQALLEAALNSPDLFKGIILVASSPCFVEKKDFQWGRSQAVARRMLKDLKKDFTKTMEKFYPLNFTEEELETDGAKWFLGYYKGKSAMFHHDSVAKGLEALFSFDIRKSLNGIKVPVLIIQGSEDNVCPSGASTYLAKNLRNAKIEIISAGHVPFLTRRKEFNKIVRGFIETL